MIHKNFRIFGTFALLVISLLSINLVLAVTAPTGLTFNRNVTAIYDEGNFSVNWSAGAADTVSYSIYIFNGTAAANAFVKAANNSVRGYSFNNWTEGNYTFKIGAVNATAETNSTNISMYVDRTAPVIALPLYTDGTAKKNTSQLTLNVSVSDASSGLTGSMCNFDIYGTNESVSVTGGWCNTTALNLTGLSDGNYTIKVYVNDTVNILGLNNTFYVKADTTVPIAAPTCSPSTVTVEDPFPCSCDGSDSAANSSGLNSSLIVGSSTSPEDILTPLSSGVFTYTCSVTDNAGNYAILTAIYTVREKISHGVSGGSSSVPSITAPIKSQTFAEITPGAASIVKNFDANTGLKEIQITVNNPAQDVKVTVTKYDSKPASVSVEKTGKIYQYLQINVSNVGDKLDKAVVTTKVKKSWVSENALDKENLALLKFDDSAGKWNELATAYSTEDNTYYYYTTDLTSFSYFAIGEKSLVSSQESAGATSGEGATLTTTSTMMWIWVAIGAIVVIIATAILVRKRKKKR